MKTIILYYYVVILVRRFIPICLYISTSKGISCTESINSSFHIKIQVSTLQTHIDILISIFIFRTKHKHKRLSAAEVCDLLKMAVLISCSMLLMPLDTSMMYHVIKSQSVIKLYIFFNMLEVIFKPFFLIYEFTFLYIYVYIFYKRLEIDYFHHLAKTF